jgi:hypothetical protein
MMPPADPSPIQPPATYDPYPAPPSADPFPAPQSAGAYPVPMSADPYPTSVPPVDPAPQRAFTNYPTAGYSTLAGRTEVARRRRAPVVAIVIIIIVALVGGAVAAVVAFMAAKPKTNSEPHNNVVTSAPAGGAPRDLKLRDSGTSVTLTWSDPSAGTVPFIVAGGRQGALRQLQTVEPGTTTYTLNGLNPKLDYCFTVAAVYDTSRVELSDLTCTKR